MAILISISLGFLFPPLRAFGLVGNAYLVETQREREAGMHRALVSRNGSRKAGFRHSISRVYLLLHLLLYL